MTQDDDKFPRYAHDLVGFLDNNIQLPQFPATANQFRDMDDGQVRSAAFTAGARSIVDMLVEWRDERDAQEEEDEAPVEARGVSDEAAPIFPRLFDAAGKVREVISSVHVARNLFGRKLDD